MRCTVLVLLLSTFIFCADYDIHKLAEVFSGMNKRQSDKLDEILGKVTDSSGKRDEAKYKKLLKDNGLENKVMKLRQTMATVAKEDKIAAIYIAAALDYAHRARRGNMSSDDASERTSEEWNRLSMASKKYIAKKFPGISSISD